MNTGQPTRRNITEGMIALGAKQGDVVYIRCDLSADGVRKKDAVNVFLGGIQDAIGPHGTVIANAFVKQGFRFGYVPTSGPQTPPYTGAFSKLLLAQPRAYRSIHPTHSLVGLGEQAREVLEPHYADGACFEPMRKLARIDGLMAVIGCVERNPGFSTLHLAQYDLGLSQRHYTKWFWTVRLPNGNLFRKTECPGCSDNAGVLYELYARDGNLVRTGVGAATAVSARACAAFALELDLLAREPRYFLCERPDCLSCHTLRGYNKRAIPRSLVHRALKTVRQSLASR